VLCVGSRERSSSTTEGGLVQSGDAEECFVPREAAGMTCAEWTGEEK
jgi:hypothetical protein